MSARSQILKTALTLIKNGAFENASVSDICARSEVSNGSFFHAFPKRENLSAALYLQILVHYHSALRKGFDQKLDAASGIRTILGAHIDWVVTHKPFARFLFEEAKSDWLQSIQAEQTQENEKLREELENWRQPLLEKGQLIQMPPLLFFAQLIGPAQLLCRGYLVGKTQFDSHEMKEELIQNAQRALIP